MILTKSARKRGYTKLDVLNVIENHTYWVREFDEPRPPSTTRPDLFVGPACDETVLEVMLNVHDSKVVVFHVMPFRESVARRAGIPWN